MIQIIKANIEHSELIADLGKKSFLEAHGDSASAEDINHFILKTYTRSAISQEFKNSNVQYHIIYFDNIAAGFSKIELNTPYRDISELDVTKLDRLYLLKKFYDQNLGSKLFDFNVQLSIKHKQKGIWLAVWIENQRAINFYFKKGFKTVGKYNFQISDTHSNPNHIMYLKHH